MDLPNTFEEFYGINYEYHSKKDMVLQQEALMIAENLSSAESETLFKCYNFFPMDSGGTPSKSGRAMLQEKNLIQYGVSKSNDDIYVVTYPLGYQVLRALNVLLEIKV